MTWLSRISFSLLAASVALAANLSGTVQLSNSRLSTVRRGRDYSGVVVWLEPVNATSVHETSKTTAGLTVEQKDKKFIPHILAAPVGATVRFPNLDPIFHSVFSNFSGQIFDFGLYAPGASRKITFTRPGVVRIFCNIHPTMSAVIVVVRSSWFAVSDAAGSYTIPAVPPGDYRLEVFHERATQETLEGLARRIQISNEDAVLPPMTISESGYLETPHKNKYGLDYPPVPDDGAYSARPK